MVSTELHKPEAGPMAEQPAASSSTEGFFQEKPVFQPSFSSDVTVRRAFELYLPSHIKSAIAPDLTRFSALCNTPQTRRNTINAEAHLPYVRTWDTFGKRQDELITSEGWRNSTAVATKEGIVSIGYETDKWGSYARTYQFIKSHLWSSHSCGVTCPSAMQDGAAALLSKQLSVADLDIPEETQAVLREALRRLLSRDPTEAWTSGQWMTERPGGSDVRNTETRATFTPDSPSMLTSTGSDGSPLGPWSISGFKWFSSATDANMTVLLAKTGPSDELSAFFAPTKRLVSSGSGTSKGTPEPQLESNGIEIQRLKNKLGTKPLPTAELVLKDMRAHMIGKPGQGTKEISSILNITRIHTGVGAVAGFAKGLTIARNYARVRRSSGKLLMDLPAHVKGLAEQTVQCRAYTDMVFLAVALLGISETGAQTSHAEFLPGAEVAGKLLRLLTPVLKSQASLASIAGLRFCMEALGGVGYLENEDPEMNVARLFRDANVLSIWEGTTDVLALDTVRVVKGRDGREVLDVLSAWVKQALTRWQGQKKLEFASSAGLEKELEHILKLVHGNDTSALLYHGRELMESVAWTVCAVVLVEDALRDGNDVAFEVAKRWITTRNRPGRVQSTTTSDWKQEAEWDRRIVFGEPAPVRGEARL